jgi:hypothetical protein
MNEIDHFKKIILYSDDVAANMYHLHVKKIHLVSFSYIVIEDKRKGMARSNLEHSFKIGRLRWTLVEVGGRAITVAPELCRFELLRSFLEGESVGRRRGI